MLPNWEIALAEYINRCSLRPFKWGEQDCLTFANTAYHKIKGFGFADEFLGSYTTAKGAAVAHARFLKKTGYKDIIEGFDDRMTRLQTKYPPRGTVVARPQEGNEFIPYAFGIMVNQYCAFVGSEYLIFSKPADDMMFWS
jgi:hypothetical protein